MSWSRFFRREPLGRRAGARARGAPGDRDRREHRARHDAATRRATRRGASSATSTLIREEIYRMNTVGLARHHLAGSALRRAAAAPQSRLRHRRDPVAGARRRRQHRDLPAARRGSPAHAAGRRTPSSSSRSASQDGDGRTGWFDGPASDSHQPAVGAHPRSAGGVLRASFAWGTPTFDLSAGGESRAAQGLWVSGDFFTTLGVRPCSAACSPPTTIVAAAPRRRR